MSAVPVRYMNANLLFGDGGQICALYKLPTVAYDLLPDGEKEAWLWVLAGLAFNARADLSIYRVSRRWPADAYVDQAAGLVDSRHADPAAWRSFLESHVAHIERLDSHVPEVYLRVAMSKPSHGGRARATMRNLELAFRRVSTAFGVGLESPILAKDLEALHAAQSLVFDRVRSAMPLAQPASTQEIEWLCRRAALRHVTEPVLDPNWHPNAMVIFDPEADDAAFHPRASDFRRLSDCVVTRHRDYVHVIGDGGESYQAFLTLGALPLDVYFPGPQAEMFFRPLEDLDFPVDVVAHYQWIANRRALAEVAKAIKTSEHDIDEATAAFHRPDHLKMIAPELGRDLEAALKASDRPPMLNGGGSLGVSAPSLAELERRVDEARGNFTDIVLHRPAGMQQQLFEQHMLRPGGSVVHDWDEMITLEQFGMMMPIATRQVGAERGVYIGYLTAAGRPRTPVYLDLTAAAKASEPTSIYVTGRQGSGKTVGSLFMATVAGAFRGSYVLTADPGPDHYITEMPGLENESLTIGLAGDARYRGMLDPLVVTPPELREEIAISYYLEILPRDPYREGAWETELTAAVRETIAKGGGSLAMLKHLEEGEVAKDPEAAKDLAGRLGLLSDSGLGVLAFGDGTNTKGFADIKRVTTITMADLGLPSSDTPRDAYDRRQRVAVATFKLVAAYLMWLVTHDRTVHKVVVLDEAWVFEGADGQQLLDKLVRLGRKYNTTVIICSQTVSDLGELKKLIGQYFIFGVNSPEEAELALSLIGLDPEDKSLVAKLSDKQVFRAGRCLHRDSRGRVAEMQIDTVHSWILDTLNTTPDARPADVRPLRPTPPSETR